MNNGFKQFACNVGDNDFVEVTQYKKHVIVRCFEDSQSANVALDMGKVKSLIQYLEGWLQDVES